MKKYLFLFILAVAGFCTASAGEPVKGIIATYEGSDTSYKLEDMPTIKYETIEGTKLAVLFLKDQVAPVLSVVLAEGKQLVVVYGEYVPPTPTAIEGVADKVVITERNGKKVVNGGKLIIIGKDGKMYDATGLQIKL